MRWLLLLLLLPSVLLTNGCSSSSDYSYSIAISTEAQPDTIYVGTPTTLLSYYHTDNVAVYLTAQDWTVVTAPDGYVLSDFGREADFTPSGPGTYVVRYRTWYYTNYDYDSCYCTYATGYRESYVSVTAVLAPAG